MSHDSGPQVRSVCSSSPLPQRGSQDDEELHFASSPRTTATLKTAFDPVVLTQRHGPNWNRDYDTLIIILLRGYLPALDCADKSVCCPPVAQLGWEWSAACTSELLHLAGCHDTAGERERRAASKSGRRKKFRGALLSIPTEEEVEQAALRVRASEGTGVALLRHLRDVVVRDKNSDDPAAVAQRVNVRFGSHTVLSLAAINNDVEAVHYLLSIGADPEIADYRAGTVAHVLAAAGNWQLLTLLLLQHGFATPPTRPRINVLRCDSFGRSLCDVLVCAALARVCCRDGEHAEYFDCGPIVGRTGGHRVILHTQGESEWASVCATLLPCFAAVVRASSHQLSIHRFCGQLRLSQKRPRLPDPSHQLVTGGDDDDDCNGDDGIPKLIPAFVPGGPDES